MWWVIVASLIGSATALFIAFKAYPYQKQQDRNFKLGEERREAYRKFVTTVLQQRDELLKARKRIDPRAGIDLSFIGEVSFKLGLEHALLSLCADQEIIEKSGEIVAALREKQAEMRAAFSGDRSESYSAQDVQAMLVDLVNSTADEMRERLSETLTLMRNREFALSDGDKVNLSFARLDQ